MTTDEFVVTYDGDAFTAHSIDAATFARSMLALGDVIGSAQKAGAPDAPPIRLRISATGEGSFLATLIAEVPTVVDQAVSLLTSGGTEAFLNAAAVVGLGIGGWKALKKIAGRRITGERAQGGDVVLILEDGEEMVVSAEVARLLRDPRYRRSTEDFFSVLQVDGASSVSISSVGEDAKVRFEAFRAEAVFFDRPDSELVGPSSSITDDVLIKPLGVEFDWRAWRVTDGEATYSVKMADDAFRGQVDRNEVQLGSTDSLRVRLRVDQVPKADGTIKTTRTVEKVNSHVPGPRQDRLPLS